MTHVNDRPQHVASTGMTRESEESKPEDLSHPQLRTAKTGQKHLRRKDLTPEALNELQHRRRVIGAGLKRMFDGVTTEPIPADFLQLIEKIGRMAED